MVQKVNAWIRPLRQRYFRSEIVGLHHLPPNEPSMIVGNHDGGYVFPDAICLGSFYYDERGTSARRLYAMMHDFPFRIAPTLTEWLQRCGVLPASRRNSDAGTTPQRCSHSVNEGAMRTGKSCISA